MATKMKKKKPLIEGSKAELAMDKVAGNPKEGSPAEMALDKKNGVVPAKKKKKTGFGGKKPGGSASDMLAAGFAKSKPMY